MQSWRGGHRSQGGHPDLLPQDARAGSAGDEAGRAHAEVLWAPSLTARPAARREPVDLPPLTQPQTSALAQYALGGALLSGVPPGESPAAGEKKTSVSRRAAAGGFPSCLQPGLRLWTTDEDALIVELRKTYQWSVVAEKLGTSRSQHCCCCERRFYRLSATGRAATPQTGLEWSSTLCGRAEDLFPFSFRQTSATRRGPAASAPGGDDHAGVRTDAAAAPGRGPFATPLGAAWRRTTSGAAT